MPDAYRTSGAARYGMKSIGQYMGVSSVLHVMLCYLYIAGLASFQKVLTADDRVEGHLIDSKHLLYACDISINIH